MAYTGFSSVSSTEEALGLEFPVKRFVTRKATTARSKTPKAQLPAIAKMDSVSSEERPP